VAVALGSPNAFADVRALFEYGFSRYVRARLADRGQPVSQASGRPAAYQADADADALVRLDQLGQVRLALAPSTAGGASGTAGGGSGAAGGGTGTAGAVGAGTAGADPGGASVAWFTVGGRRLVGVRLVRLAGGAPGPTSATLAAPTLPGGATSATGLTTAAGTPGATLTVGTVVQLRPVPPGAAPPVIDPFLRRAPP
jgi:DNA polymerase III subunit gamma/tau